MNPYFAAFAAITGYAALIVIAKKVQLDIPSFSFIAITMALLTLFSAIVAFIYEKDFSITNLSQANWIWLISFSLINLVAFSLLLFAISKIPVVEYQIIAVITPIIGGSLGYLILSEALTARYFIGLIFIAIGLYISLKK